jgi:hypothetical protein
MPNPSQMAHQSSFKYSSFHPIWVGAAPTAGLFEAMSSSLVKNCKNAVDMIDRKVVIFLARKMPGKNSRFKINKRNNINEKR